MALSVELGLVIDQMDIVTAFWNGEVKEELCMLVPEKFLILLKKIGRKGNFPACCIQS